MLNVDRIVIGSLGHIGETYTVSSRTIDVETAETIGIAYRQRRGSIDDVMEYDVKEVVKELLLINKETLRPERKEKEEKPVSFEI